MLNYSNGDPLNGGHCVAFETSSSTLHDAVSNDWLYSKLLTFLTLCFEILRKKIIEVGVRVFPL